MITMDLDERLKMSGDSALKTEPWYCHLLGLLNPLLVITSNLIGGIWVVSGLIFMLGIGPIFDQMFGRSSVRTAKRQQGLPLERLLYVHAILQCVSVVTLIYRASIDGPAWTSWLAALSTGLNSGASGIIVAHELGHRKNGSAGWWLGRLNLLTVLYLHFTTEHNFTHHQHVSTTKDPATARKGESLWWFFARTVPGQFLDAVAVHKRKKRRGLRNPVWQGFLLQSTLVAVLGITLEVWVAAVFCLHAFFAIFLLEYINYIRHYGLTRELGKPLLEEHSWQAEQRWSRWTLLELTRHPAHHLKAGEPFWKLQPSDKAPHLPSGYYGCFWIAVIPPLWRRSMRNRLPV